MSHSLPARRLGVILYSGNRTVEPYFRAYAPPWLAVHATRMRMGSGGLRRPEHMAADAVEAARLLGEAGVDLVNLQATGIMMERGPDGEAALVVAIGEAAGCPALTSTQASVEALRALGAVRIVLITPGGEAALGRERAYLEAVGLAVVRGAALDLGRETGAGELDARAWLDAARARDRPEAEAVFLSGSNTTMIEAIRPIEDALAKPAVTSVQAALWAAVRRLAPGPRATAPPPALGRLFETA